MEDWIPSPAALDAAFFFSIEPLEELGTSARGFQPKADPPRAEIRLGRKFDQPKNH